MKPPTKLVRVVAPHFVAAMDVAGGKCVEAAPILGWCKGKTEADLRAYFKRKGWKATVIDPMKHTNQL